MGLSSVWVRAMFVLKVMWLGPSPKLITQKQLECMVCMCTESVQVQTDQITDNFQESSDQTRRC